MLRVFQKLISPIWRHLRLFLVLILFYLLQQCVIPYFKPAGVTPNLLWVMLSVVVASYDWYDSAFCGAIVGIITETMCPTLPMLNLVGYLVITILAVPFFMPKSTRKLLQAKYAGKTAANTHRYRKTVFCTAATNFAWQTVNCAYVFLNNNTIPGEFITRGIANVVFTTAIGSIIIPFMWMLLGIKRQRKEEETD